MLIKKEEASFWSSVVPGDVKGIHDIEGEEEEKIKQVHEGLSHLTSDKEEQVPYLCINLFFIVFVHKRQLNNIVYLEVHCIFVRFRVQKCCGVFCWHCT